MADPVTTEELVGWGDLLSIEGSLLMALPDPKAKVLGLAISAAGNYISTNAQVILAENDGKPLNETIGTICASAARQL